MVQVLPTGAAERPPAAPEAPAVADGEPEDGPRKAHSSGPRGRIATWALRQFERAEPFVFTPRSTREKMGFGEQVAFTPAWG
jgi:hypothetical protein